MCRKYEEVNPPPVNDFVLITDCTYTRVEVCCRLSVSFFFALDR